MYFVGNWEKPFAIGTKEKLMACVDGDFWSTFDTYRNHKAGMQKIDISSQAWLFLGVRALMEQA